MDVKPGYKKTEVGVIPEEWGVNSLATICRETITYGIVQCGPHIQGGVPYIRVSDMASGRELDVTTMLRTSPLIAHRFKRSTVAQGDIVYALRGKIGEVRVVPFDVAGANLTQGTARIAVRVEYCNDYILFALGSDSASSQATLGAKGSTFVEITLESLRKIQLPLPPLPEQLAIAATLSDVDALIAQLDQLIAKKRDLKQAAMQQLLTGKSRLPGFSGDWEVKPLRELVSVPVTDGPHSTPVFASEGVPFLSVNNLVDNKLDFSDLRYISKKDDKVFSLKCKPLRGDILMGKAASVGKVAYVDTDLDFNIWSPLALIRVGLGGDQKFVYFSLQSRDVVSQVRILTNASSQGNIGMGDIERLLLPWPRNNEQTAIAQVLSDIDAEITSLEGRRDKTKALKQGMMQELLTGRIRLV